MAIVSETHTKSGRMRIIISAVAAFVVVLVTVGVFAWNSRQASGKEYPVRQKVASQSNLHFSFPERMDHASVEALLQASEEVSKAIRWEEDVLVLDPNEALQPAAVYTFTLPASAKKADGTFLGRNLRFEFTVAGPPVVAARIPMPEATGIGSDSKMTMVFDRPMIALSQVQGEFAKDTINEWPVTIEPAVAGRWRWISTVAREFIPDASLKAGTKYTVRVPAGIVSVAGDTTEVDFSWSFETLRPEVLQTDPEQNTALAGPKTLIRLTFNRPIDLASAASHIALYKEDPSASSVSPSSNASVRPTGALVPIQAMHYATQVVEGKTVTDPMTVVVRPAQPLSFVSAYRVDIAEGLIGTEGELGLSQAFHLKFSTVGDLTVQSSGYDELGGEISLNFSNPIDAATLSGGIRITPPLAEGALVTWTVNEWGDAREVRGYFSSLPSTTYTVTVGAGVKDQSEQSLKEPFTFTFTTPQTPPRAFIHSKGAFGIFERGKPPIFYLNAVNVSRIDVSFAKLSLDDLLRKQSSDRYGQTPLVLEGKALFQKWQLPTAQKLNEWEVIPFDPEERTGKKLEPGIYALQMTAPEYSNPWDPANQVVESQIFTLTNLAVTLKYSGDDLLVWVTDMQTGKPVSDARITVHTLDGRTPVAGRTDTEGFFTSAYSIKDMVTANNEWEPEFWVTAETEDDSAMIASNWTSGIRPYSFGLNEDFRSAQAGAYRLDGYLYTERPIYKAGDTVSFKGIVRLRDWDGAFSLPSDRTVSLRVQDAQGNEISNTMVPISAFGSFSGSIVIDALATLGDYSIQAALSSESEIWNNYLGGSFMVLAYRKPEYQVTITPDREDYFDGETASALVEGSYYFGAPMDNATVYWRAQMTDYYFNKMTDGWYSFSLEDAWCWYGCERKTEMVAEGEGTLDSAGRMQITLPLSLEGKSLSQVLTIEADITDANNQVVSNRTSVYVHKADAYVGIKTQEYVVQPGEETHVDLVTVRPDGTPLGNQPVTLQLFARTWNSIQKKSVDGAYYYDNEPKDTFIRTVTVRTDAQGKATAAVRIADGGEFRIRATVQDAAGREAQAAVGVYAWSSDYFNWPRTNTDRMEVQVDKPEYKLGETASLLIKSPYQGAGVKALVTVEREGILSRRVIDIVSNAQSIDIPVTEDLIPNAYVSVVVVKARQGETFDAAGSDTGAPAFKIGYAKLLVDTSSKRLHVAVQTDKAQYGPRETVRVTLKATDAAGKGVPAELSLGTVDMSLLALSSFETPDLTRLFYAERGLGISTAHLFTYLLERFKPGSKGGGGANGEAQARGDFKDTAYWNPSIMTDAEGNATVSFRLPDNLTTWQLLAIGSTKDHQFGSQAVTIIETKQVIIRSVRPRFAVQGDRIELGAIVHNFLSEKQTFAVRLSGSGFTAATTNTQVSVESGGQATVNFPMIVGSTDVLTMRLRAETTGAIDEIVESIPVYEFSSPQSVATTGMTESVALEQVIAPNTNDAKDGTLSITVAPTLAAYLPDALEYLATYPYGCTEQTLSAFLPAVALLQLENAGSKALGDRKELERKVTTGLGRLYAFQRDDGGFGYWESSTRSYAPLSAYVLYGLIVTKQAGISVDDGAIDRLVSYLQNVLRIKEENAQTNAAQRAAILYALALSGRGDLSLLNNLYEERDVLPIFARAQLALSFAQLSSGSSQARTIIGELLNAAKVDSRGTHFEEEDIAPWGEFMNTTDRTTALVLDALLTVDPQNVLIPNITRYLLTARKDGHWDTTQSTVQALLAFAKYLEQTGETDAEFRAGVQVNDAVKLDWDVKKGTLFDVQSTTMSLDDLKRGKKNDVRIGLTGKGRLYYDLLLSYLFTGDVIAPAEEGIGITRDMRPLTGQSTTGYQVGETYIVTLTVTTSEERRFVAVESPVPAGMEIIDLALETSQQSLLSKADDTMRTWDETYWQSGLWHFTHHEVRDDRFFLFAETLPAGVYQYHYLVRATTPGTYRQRPAHAFEMYFPEVFGQTEGGLVTISH